MALNNFPAALQPIFQQGYLERLFHQALRANFAYRDVATREPFPGAIGETLTRTRAALLPAITTPSTTSSNTDLDNGMVAQDWKVEQYVMSLLQYKATMDLNMFVSPLAIASKFVQNVKVLAEQAARSVETLAQQALYNTFLGQNTRVMTTLGSPGTTVAVDDIRGFGSAWTTSNVPVAVSGSNPLSVTFIRAGAYSNGANSSNTTGGTYNVTAVTADGTNTSVSPGGISGTLTFSGNVATADATAGNAVMAAVAPIVQRPYNRASVLQLGLGDTLTMQMLLNAKQTLVANGVAPFSDGLYRMIVDPYMVLPLYQDTAFQRFQIGHTESREYRRGVIAELLGVQLIESTITPIQNGISSGPSIHRGIMCGDGVLIESDFTPTGYDAVRNSLESEEITVADGIAHITRPPLDRLGQNIAQSWTYVGGFVAPTDLGTNSQTVPTAGNSAWKRAIVLETTAV
jgi:hypothetical protein